MTTAEFDFRASFESKLKQADMNEKHDLAAVLTLMDYIAQDTSTTTIQEFMDNMDRAQAKICLCTSSLSARTSCELFVRYITLSHVELEGAVDFRECQKILLEKGSEFVTRLKQNAAMVIKEASYVIEDGNVVLTHSRSKLILDLMTDAHKKGKKFKVYVTDGQPSCQGRLMTTELLERGIKAEFIYDTEVAFRMERISSIVVGAEGVLDDGGAICRIGFFNIALAAKEFRRRVDVLVESHKFARFFTLSNNRLPEDILYSPKSDTKKDKEKHPLVDYTPAKYINLIYSDIGTLPTSAVGEYLLDLYT